MAIDRSLAQFMRHQKQRIALSLRTSRRRSQKAPAVGEIVLIHRTAQGTKQYHDVELPKDQTRERF